MQANAGLTEIVNTLRTSLVEERGVDAELLSDDSSLFVSQALDSLDFVWLETFVMENYGVDLRAADTMIEDFDTLQRIATRITASLGLSKTAPAS